MIDEPGPQRFDPSQLRPGPIRHESLSAELLEQIGAIYAVLGFYLEKTLEQFEIGFMRDMNPEAEIALWCSIAAAWFDYHDRFRSGEALPNDQERKLLAALIAISAGEDDLQRLPVTEEVGEQLLACYEDLVD